MPTGQQLSCRRSSTASSWRARRERPARAPPSSSVVSNTPPSPSVVSPHDSVDNIHKKLCRILAPIEDFLGCERNAEEIKPFVEQLDRCCDVLNTHTINGHLLRGAEIHANFLGVRLAKISGDKQALDKHSKQHTQLLKEHLDPATARLPRCRGTPFAGRAAPERLARYPEIWRARRLVTDAECELLISAASGSLNRSGLGVESSKHKGFRTSRTAWIKCAVLPQLADLTRRVAALLNLPVAAVSMGECEDSGHLQVVRYQPQQEYGVHHDCDGVTRRYATVLLYLCDVDGGGETHFPVAGDDEEEWACIPSVDAAVRGFRQSRHGGGDGGGAMAASVTAMRDGGLKVAPRKGDAILFYNYDRNGVMDPRAIHAALPVSRGHKFIANYWISISPHEMLSGVNDGRFSRSK